MKKQTFWVCFFYAFVEIKNEIPIFMGIKNEKGEREFTFLPQIYHKLNLLMLW